MAYNGIQPNGLYGQQQQLIPGDFVSGEQYRYALANFRIAHEKVESQRKQLEEQERQVAQLRERIATLEGDDDQSRWQKIGEKAGGSSVDDFSIKNTASQLEKQINRWAAEVVRLPPAPLEEVYDALLEDILNGEQPPALDPQPMVIQNLLRHIMSEMISEGLINCLIVTNSQEANLHVSRIHEHIFDRDPTVASVWRRQTFTAAVENCSTEMTGLIISEHMPSLEQLLSDNLNAMHDILNSAYSFSRMLHGSKSTTSGMGDAFYRAFVPELSVVLSPRQVELVKRCIRSERNEVCRVGACVFPGLVKVTQIEGQQNVVRKAHVVCECALSSRNA